jgi:hypothetical protein
MANDRLIHMLTCSMSSLSGNNGNQWRMGSVNVNMGAEFYFIIEGTLEINHESCVYKNTDVSFFLSYFV